MVSIQKYNTERIDFMERIQWMNASVNEHGISTIGFVDMSQNLNVGRIVGYNGIKIGDSVIYSNNTYKVSQASRLGHFKLVKDKQEFLVFPKDVQKVSER